MVTKKIKIMIFCHWECLFREFFGVRTVENVKNQKILFDFVFLYKNTSEKLVLPRIWSYDVFIPTPINATFLNAPGGKS